jgi:hypothetical protein
MDGTFPVLNIGIVRASGISRKIKLPPMLAPAVKIRAKGRPPKPRANNQADSSGAARFRAITAKTTHKTTRTCLWRQPRLFDATRSRDCRRADGG